MPGVSVAPVSAFAGDKVLGQNPETEKLTDYPLFDWLRFLLASVVLWAHEGIRFPHPITGGLAVSVFFALSGWLIGGILIKSERGDLSRFFFNRSTRIWAPYFAAIVLLYSVAALREGINFYWFKYLFYDITFTHVNFTIFPRAFAELPLNGTGNAFWSIAVEEQFYLAAPLLMLFTRWGKTIAVWAIIAATAIALRSLYAPIAAGVLAAVLNRDFAIVATSARRYCAADAAMCSFLGLYTMHVDGPADGEPWRSLFSVFVVLALTVPGQRTAVSTFFGGISFPLYLNQWVGGYVVNFAEKIIAPLPHVAHLIVTYLASVAVAIVSWWVIDRNVMIYRNGWYTPRRGWICGVTAYCLVGIGLIGGYLLRGLGY